MSHYVPNCCGCSLLLVQKCGYISKKKKEKHSTAIRIKNLWICWKMLAKSLNNHFSGWQGLLDVFDWLKALQYFDTWPSGFVFSLCLDLIHSGPIIVNFLFIISHPHDTIIHQNAVWKLIICLKVTSATKLFFATK